MLVRSLRSEVGALLQTVYATAAVLQLRLPADWALERRILADLRTRGTECANVLHAVHDLVCPMSLNAEPVNLGELASALVGAAVARHPQLEIWAEGGPVPSVLGDLKRLAQLGNLLLSQACQRARRQVTFQTREGRGEMEWVVTDDGPDMPADQVEPSHSGSGSRLSTRRSRSGRPSGRSYSTSGPPWRTGRRGKP
jgi:hypothetical protein